MVPRHLHAPRELVTRERHVAQAGADERQRLVVTRPRHHEVLALRVQRLQALLEGGQLEEVVVLLLARQLDVVNRAAVALVDLVVGLEVGAARAVPALVGALVHVPVLAHTRQHLLDDRFVLGVCRADEEVVGRRQLRRERFEALGVAIRQLLRLDAERVGRVRHRLAVLVRARQEEHLLAALAVVARHHVRGDRRVRVAEVRRRVDVVDGGGYVEGHAVGCKLPGADEIGHRRRRASVLDGDDEHPIHRLLIGINDQ